MFEWEFNFLCDLYPTSASKELSNFFFFPKQTLLICKALMLTCYLKNVDMSG